MFGRFVEPFGESFGRCFEYFEHISKDFGTETPGCPSAASEASGALQKSGDFKNTLLFFLKCFGNVSGAIQKPSDFQKTLKSLRASRSLAKTGFVRLHSFDGTVPLWPCVPFRALMGP